MAAALQTAPGRLFGVAVVPTADPDAMTRELDRAINELGFVGCEVAVGPTVKRVDDPSVEALFAQTVELDVPL